MIFKNIYFISCPELYIKKAIYQLSKNCIYYITLLDWFIISNLYPKDEILVDLQLYFKTFCFNIKIIYLEDCILAY